MPTVELLAGKYGMSVDQARDAQRQMEQRAGQDGLTFRMAELRSGNTRDAHRLLHLARAHGLQAELAEWPLRSYFTDRQSVFDAGVLTDLAVDVGLERDEVFAASAYRGRRGEAAHGDRAGRAGNRLATRRL